MPLYQSVYGLRIATNRGIPGLPLSENSETDDLEVHLNDETEFPALANQEFFYTSEYRDVSGQPTLRVGRLSGGAYGLFYSDGASFAVHSNGRQIVAKWPVGYCLEDAATYLIGPVLALALRLRGQICLHASAVVVEKRAIALVGAPGSGKSTTAAAFAKCGYPVLSDDVVALTEKGEPFLVQPGYPRLNLWPDSAGALFGAEAALLPITPTWEKRFLALDQGSFRFESQPLPLGIIYVLGSPRTGGSVYSINPIELPLAMITLAANTHVNYLLDKEMRSHEFGLLSRLVNSVTVRRVEPPQGVAHLDKLCEAIAADAKKILGEGSASFRAPH